MSADEQFAAERLERLRRIASLATAATMFHEQAMLRNIGLIRSEVDLLAPTPDSERAGGSEVGLSAHFRRMQDACANYVEPTTYIARHPDLTKVGDCKWVREFPEPTEGQSPQGAADTKQRRDQAFIADMIYMLDGPEQRAAEAPTPERAGGWQQEQVEALNLARLFHDTYERLAPMFGYETREDTKVFDADTPNGRLMIAVCSDLLASLVQPNPEAGAVEAVAEIIRSYNPKKCGVEWPRNAAKAILAALTQPTGG